MSFNRNSRRHWHLQFILRFDEVFDLILPDSVDTNTAFLHICVKDRGVMGEGIFLGEAYLPLNTVLQTNMNIGLQVKILVV